MLVHLIEKEEEGDFHLHELYLDVGTTVPEGWSVRRSLEVTPEDVGRGKPHLYGLFGITDLEPKPGLPRGPYYAV